ncbi:hypothetical protein M8494_20635 [Serratia ureilytica]
MNNVTLNIRQQYAAAAMQALVISGLNTGAWSDYSDLAKSAYNMADAMMDAELLTTCVEINLREPAFHYIRTHSGRQFWYEAISPNMIDIGDIAQALSNICRFCGHLDDFYSVAQHSGSGQPPCSADLAMERCCMMPASLLRDIGTAQALLPDYRDTEALVDSAVRPQDSVFANSASPEVKRADLIMLATERRDLDIDDGDKWDILKGIEPTDKFTVCPLNPRQARSYSLLDLMSCSHDTQPAPFELATIYQLPLQQVLWWSTCDNVIKISRKLWR